MPLLIALEKEATALAGKIEFSSAWHDAQLVISARKVGHFLEEIARLEKDALQRNSESAEIENNFASY